MGNAVSMSNIEVKALLNKTNIKSGSSDLTYLSQVGGIAFQKTAVPDSGLTVSSIKLLYDKDRKDGERLRCQINGSDVAINLYDWEIKPIAMYSDTFYTACFSLFGTPETLDGKLVNSTSESDSKIIKEYREKYNIKHFASYHPSFKDTLVGLRLMQMDSFYIADEFGTIPTGQYLFFLRKEILGNGEKVFVRDFDHQQKILELEKEYYLHKLQAYVICDETNSHSENIKFNINNNNLVISANPYVYVWDTRINTNTIKSLMSEYNIPFEYYNSIYELIYELISAPEKGEEKKGEEIFQNIASQLNNQIISQQITYEKGSKIADAIESVSVSFLENPRNNKYYDVIHVKELSDYFFKHPEVLRDINPLAYDCTRKVMQYSAFFRYCMKINPDNWRSFISSITSIAVDPKVNTPNVVLNQKVVQTNDIPLWIIITGLSVLIIITIIIIIVLKKKR